MTRTRVVVFFGTRPEAIKLAPVVRVLEATGAFETLIINTGQHQEMLEPILRSLDLTAHLDLRVMRAEQSLADLTARLLVACDLMLTQFAPSVALVQGDTTTAFAAALACFYRKIGVAHVEAGLRTHRLDAPFPEEMNRVLSARLCDLHFAPTERAKRNLLAEGVAEKQIEVTGNTVIDALLAEVERQKRPDVRAGIEATLAQALGARGRPYLLVTGHRRENFGRPLRELCAALAMLATRYADHDIVYPVHLNPNVRETVHAVLRNASNVKLVEPLPYPEFVALMRDCRLVLTDSGGIQEEAPSLGKPVLVMREATERPEGIEAGTVRLVAPEATAIVRDVSHLLDDRAAYERMALAANPYGDGRASQRIVARLVQHAGARG
ncbi:MAG TPA: UDP-N-acetylglucosamine 2-epimerase (non-hydrolyzing) [Polyangiaceae bacterium]|nr:UDP-N-acetylglucosamine 2-epimerase (non-hydrolyzing) [Polyangiaceae bacterium]